MKFLIAIYTAGLFRLVLRPHSVSIRFIIGSIYRTAPCSSSHDNPVTVPPTWSDALLRGTLRTELVFTIRIILSPLQWRSQTIFIGVARLASIRFGVTYLHHPTHRRLRCCTCFLPMNLWVFIHHPFTQKNEFIRSCECERPILKCVGWPDFSHLESHGHLSQINFYILMSIH